MQDHCDMNVTERGGLATVELAGELDASAAWALAQMLTDLRERSPAAVTDLRSLKYIDSSGLRALIQAEIFLSEHGRPAPSFALGPGQVLDVLRLTGVDKLLVLVDEPPEV